MQNQSLQSLHISKPIMFLAISLDELEPFNRLRGRQIMGACDSRGILLDHLDKADG